MSMLFVCLLLLLLLLAACRLHEPVAESYKSYNLNHEVVNKLAVAMKKEERRKELSLEKKKVSLTLFFFYDLSHKKLHDIV